MIKQLKPRYTSIRQIVDVGDGFVIREDSDDHPKDKSNLYKVGYDFKHIWDAEIRRIAFGIDLYTNPVILQQDGTYTCAGGSQTYTIDVKTGKILKEEYTK